MFKNFLVICTGNICRSPMMEGLFKARLAGHSDIRVTSAGTGALVGRPAEPYAVEIMALKGMDISGHKARQANEAMLYSSDLVFVMERSHQNWIEGNFPAVRGRVFLAGKWRKAQEVPDPFMAPHEAFEKVYDQLSDYVEDWLGKLKLVK